ncbi:nucleotidyltransferase domain-containing protein, partial [Streptomyces sp. A7024]|nr:nucleotidyltransferase domain-containing protein [Streptomyces coryli]
MEEQGEREDAVAAARRVLAARHPEARAGWLCGGVLTHPTPYSDLDVVVLVDGAPAPYRESLDECGWPVELFVHSRRSWEAFVREERGQRGAALLRMTATGMLLVDTDGGGRE